MTLKESLEEFNKELLFDYYIRIIPNHKSYTRTTKEQMKDEILQEYKNYNNIIDICTTRELKYLNLLIENNNNLPYNFKYDWEINSLDEKLIIVYDDEQIYIPENLLNIVKQALDKVNWNTIKEKDKINELAIGLFKVYALLPPKKLIDILFTKLKVPKENIIEHLKTNKLFNYYVTMDSKYTKKDQILIYRNYSDIIEQLIKVKQERKIFNFSHIKATDYTSIFYNDFNLNNKIINKFYKELIKLNHYEFLKDIIIVNTLLNEKREDLYYLIKIIYSSQLKNIDEFLELLDAALDEMP